MREIKFRAWDKNTHKMISNPIVNDINSATNYIGLNELFKKYSEKGFAIMQLTGLLDSKGNEIYAGDIVNWECLGFHTSEVKLDIVGFYIENTAHIEEVDERFRFDFPFKNLEVIGNIYQNPDLLK